MDRGACCKGHGDGPDGVAGGVAGGGEGQALGGGPVAELGGVTRDADGVAGDGDDALGEGDGDGGRAAGGCRAGALREGSRCAGVGACDEDNGVAVGGGDANVAVAVGRYGGAVAVDIGPAAVGPLRVEAVLRAGATTRVCGEDNKVAASSAPGVGSVGDVQVDVVVAGKSTSGLPCISQLLDGLVEITVGVEVAAPEILAVSWVVATSIALLGSVVQDWDSTREDDIGQGVLEQSPVVLHVQPALVVVVVQEGAQCCGVRERVADGVHHVNERLRRAFLLVEVVHWVVNRIVEETWHELGVFGKVRWVSVEYLANVINTGCRGESRPKVLLDVLDRVDADSVKLVPFYEPGDPGVEQGTDLTLGCEEVGEIGNLAYLDTGLIAVVDGTVCVV